MAFSDILGTAIVEVRAKTDKLKSDLKKTTGVVEGAAAKMRTALSSLGNVGLLGLTAGIAAFGKKAITATAEIEKMRASFSAMLGDAQKADGLLKSLTTFSATTPFQLPDISGAARQLLAAGTAVEDVTGKLQTLGDIAAGANVPLQDMAQIFTKIQNKGRAYTEELLQLSDRGIPIIQELSKQLGITKEQVFELASQGKLTADVMNQAFSTMTSEGGIFFNQMNIQSQTLSGRWSTLVDNFNLFAAAVGDSLAPVLKLLINILIQLLNVLTKVIEAINSARDSVVNMASGIKDAAANGFNSLKDAAGEAADTVKQKMYDMWEYVVGHSVVPDMVDGIVEEFQRMKDNMVEKTKEATADVKSEFQDLEESAQKSSSTVADSFSSKGTKGIGTGGSSRGLNLFNKALSAIQSGNPQAVFQSIFSEIQNVNSGLDNMGSSLDGLGGGFDNLGSTASNVFGQMGSDANSLTSSMSNSFNSLFGSLGGGFGGIGGGGGGLFGGLLGGITNIFGSLFGGIGDIFGGLFGGFFASGGQPPTGKVSVVGEQGPELFVPNTSGTIIPNDALGGGGETINLTQTFIGVDDQIVRKIREETPGIIQAATSNTINAMNRKQVNLRK